MSWNIQRIVAAGIIMAAAIPVSAGGGGNKNGLPPTSNHPNQGSNHGAYHSHYHGYRYYGVWPYGYYVYDATPPVVVVATDDGSVVSTEYVREIPQAPVTTTATVRVLMPPSAKLWFDGAATSQTGAVRSFTTPPLDAGKTYSYKVRACWLEDGRPVVRSQVVKVTPGATAELDLR
jgi:uncharacterized protein (TIGR03000 family)